MSSQPLRTTTGPLVTTSAAAPRSTFRAASSGLAAPRRSGRATARGSRALYDDEQEAARAHDRVALGVVGLEFAGFNFPEEAVSGQLQPATAQQLRNDCWARFKETTASCCTGVWWNARAERWAARIKVDRVQHDLGTFRGGGRRGASLRRSSAAPARPGRPTQLS